jgi:hypothetical protein
MDKYRMSLTAEKRSGLEQLVSRGKSSARKLTRARILLLADELQGEARADTAIVSALGAACGRLYACGSASLRRDSTQLLPTGPSHRDRTTSR